MTNYKTLRSQAAIALVEEHVLGTAEVKRLEARLKETKVELIALMGGAPVIYIGARTVSVGDVPAIPGTPARKITKEMVGQEIPAKKGRAGYQTLSVQ